MRSPSLARRARGSARAGVAALVGLALLATLLHRIGKAEASCAEFEPPGRPTTQISASTTVEAQATQLGKDVGRIFRFTRDEVLMEIYPGAMRGAKGTLWNMAGNPVDKSVLLAELLEASGIESRFVTGTLDQRKALRLACAALADAATRTSPGPRRSGGDWRYAGHLTDSQKKALESFSERVGEFDEGVREQVASSVAIVEKALQAAGIDVEDEALTTPQDLAREIAAHVWIRYRNGNQWIDLDPSFPGAEPAQTFGSAQRVMAKLPDELFHAVTLTLEIETRERGDLHRSKLLSHRAHTSDLVGQSISLLHPSAEDLGHSIGNLISGERTYSPMLVVGSDVIQGESFGVSVNCGLVCAIEGIEASLDGGSKPEEGLVAEWLIIEVESPSGNHSRVERTIFDRLGPGARSSGLGRTAPLSSLPFFEFEDTGKEFLPATSVVDIAVVTSRIPEAFFGEGLDDQNRLTDLSKINHLYHYLFDSVASREDLVQKIRYHRASPSVTMLSLGYDKGPDEHLGIQLAYDILARSLRAISIDGSEPTTSSGILAGAISHAVERFFLAPAGTTLTGSGEATDVSAGSVFERAAALDVPILAIRPGDRDVEGQLRVSGDARARIVREISEGFVVVVPRSHVAIGSRPAVGWWSIDPTTGAMHDTLQTGQGGYVDYLTVTWHRLSASGKVCLVGAAIISLTLAIGFFVQEHIQKIIDRAATIAAIPVGIVCNNGLWKQPPEIDPILITY